MISQRPPGTEARAGRFPGPSLIPDLHEIQREHGWLPREELVRLSRERRRPLYEIEGLISFYPHFRTDPPPARSVACCHDLSCWLQSGDERVAELRAEYEGDPDVEFHEVVLSRALRPRSGRHLRRLRAAPQRGTPRE